MMERPKKPDAVLTGAQIQSVIDETLTRTLDWLGRAYAVRPPDSPAEQALLEVMAGVKELKLEAQAVFAELDRKRFPSRPAATIRAARTPVT